MALRCVFPQALTWQQKLLCALTGFGTMGGVYGLFAWQVPSVEQFQEKEMKKPYFYRDDPKLSNRVLASPAVVLPSNAINSLHEKMSPDLSKHISNGIGVLGGLLVTSCFSIITFTDVQEYRRYVNTTTKCCKIIRMSMLQMLKTSFMGGMIVGSMWVTYFFAKGGPWQYHPRYKRSHE